MADQQDRRSVPRTIIRSMRSTVGRESTTYGFSILVTVTFGILQATRGAPSVSEIFLYAFGAVMSFTILEGILSGGFRKPMPQHRTETLAMGTSLNILSVCAGLGAAFAVSTPVSHSLIWVVAPFIAAVLYLFIESIETAIAEKILRAAGDAKADEVSP